MREQASQAPGAKPRPSPKLARMKRPGKADTREQRERLAAGIYGVVLVGSVIIVAAQDETLNALQVMLYALTTSIGFWLAHVYASLLVTPRGERSLRGALAGEWPLVTAAFPACIAIAADFAIGKSVEDAVNLALIVIIIQLALWGAYIAWRDRRTPLAIAGAALLNGFLGLGFIVLKVLVH